MVAPMTSYPCSARIAAATEESTPPDMATRTRPRIGSARGAGQPPGLGDERWEELGHTVDRIGRGERAEAHAHRRDRELPREPDGAQDVRWLHVPALAGRARGAGDAREIERHEERLAVGAGHRDVEDVRCAGSPATVHHG